MQKSKPYISLALPLPPSVNNLFPTGKSGRRFQSPEYRQWLDEAARITTYLGTPVLTPPHPKAQWELVANLHLSTWRRDLDGALKAPIDFIKDFMGVDDRYLIHIEANRIPCNPGHEHIHIITSYIESAE